jgi:hypothetical protein
MRNLDGKRNALGICAVAAILTGCSGSQSVNGASAALPQARPVRARVAPSPLAWNAYIVVHTFTGSPDGADPLAGIALNRDNPNVPSLLGTTAAGGDGNNDGTVYGLTPGKKGKWTESVLYTFRGGSSGDGSQPVGIAPGQDPEGNPDAEVSLASGGTSGNGALAELTATSGGSLKESFIYSFGGTPERYHSFLAARHSAEAKSDASAYAFRCAARA